jgi:hypothetical protein
MSLEADRIVVARRLESAKLRAPIYIAFVDRRPHNLARRVFHRVLAMAVVNSILRQAIPASGERVHLTTHHGVSWILVESEVGRRNGREHLRGFATGRRIASELILENEKKSLLADNLGGGAKLFVDRCTIYGAKSSSRQKSKQRILSVLNCFASEMLRSTISSWCL